MKRTSNFLKEHSGERLQYCFLKGVARAAGFQKFAPEPSNHLAEVPFSRDRCVKFAPEPSAEVSFLDVYIYIYIYTHTYTCIHVY